MKDNRKILFNDIFTLIILLIISVTLVFIPKISEKNTGQYISVFKDGIVVETLSLEKDTVYNVPDTDYTLEIKSKKVTVLSSQCPDKICEKMFVSSDGGSIICLPSKIVIRLSSEKTENLYDLMAG